MLVFATDVNLVLLAFILFALLLIGYYIFSRSHTGKILSGRDMANSVIGGSRKGKKMVIKNFSFITKTGAEKIDRIVITENGIIAFVFAAISGHLNGRENESEWFSRSKFTNKVEYFPNPIKKAKYLAKELENLYPDVQIHPVIVFLDGSLVNVHTETLTIYPRNCAQAIKASVSLTKLSPDEINALYQKMFNYKEAHKDLKPEKAINEEKKKDYEL